MGSVLYDQPAREVCNHKPKADKKGETYDRLTSFHHHISKGERQAKNEYANYHCLAKGAMPSIVLTHLHDVRKGRLEI
jgi:hypothetical protein